MYNRYYKPFSISERPTSKQPTRTYRQATDLKGLNKFFDNSEKFYVSMIH